jgi:hypothetical protein
MDGEISGNRVEKMEAGEVVGERESKEREAMECFSFGPGCFKRLDPILSTFLHAFCFYLFF